MRKTVSIIISAALLFSALLCVGCSKDIGIVVKDPLPTIEPFKEFDAKSAIVVEDGVEYSFEGYYANSKGVETAIEFNGSKFTINAVNAEVAVITAQAVKGEKSVKKEISLSIKGNPDEIDQGLYDSYADGVISNGLNYDPKYIKDGNSSLKVSFSGYYEANEWGAQFSTINGRLCTVEGGVYDDKYYSIYKYEDQAKAWEDAVMTFWVYYANTPKDHRDTKLDISYRVLWHEDEPLPEEVQKDFDFGQSPVTQCNLGEWTQIAIRFKDLNKVTPLFLDFDRYKFGWTTDQQLHEICDILSFKCRVKADDLISGGDADKMIKYNYSFYFDGLDVLTYSDFIEKYPDSDINKSKEITPQSITKNLNTASELKSFSSSGMTFVFDYKAVDSDENTGDTIQFSLWGRNWGTPRRTELITVNLATNEATFGETPIGNVEELGEGWYRVSIATSDLPINTEEGATGAETIGMIFFNTVEHAFEINNIGFVGMDS